MASTVRFRRSASHDIDGNSKRNATTLCNTWVHYSNTSRFRRGKLPHWEVHNGRYFVTVRLADSLPRDSVQRLQEIHLAISKIEPRSEQFVAAQRQYFRTMEKYLNAGFGACMLCDQMCCDVVASEFRALADWQVHVPHYSIMPNHWHALMVPEPGCTRSLPQIMKRLKGRTAKAIRRVAGGSGAVWQREWFDRWIRSDAEWDKTVSYIRQNPVRAGIVSRYEDHPWTR